MESPSPYSRLRLNYHSVVPLFEKPKVVAYTMLVLSFFTIAIFGAFAIRPTLSTIAQLRKKIEDQKSVNNRLSDKISQLRVAQAEYERVKPELNAIFESLPDTPRAASLLGKFNRTLFDNNIDVTILQISSIVLAGQDTNSSSSTVIAFTLTGNATYDNILRFIDLLSNTDRILTLDSVDISVTPVNGQVAGSSAFTRSDILTVSIKGKTYVLQDKKGNVNG